MGFLNLTIAVLLKEDFKECMNNIRIHEQLYIQSIVSDQLLQRYRLLLILYTLLYLSLLQPLLRYLQRYLHQLHQNHQKMIFHHHNQ